jgi:NADPH:quinone reductase-like Zn-dependent oxidoreductase
VLREFGGPEGIEYGDWPDPEPGPGEVLVDIVASSLNRRDWWIRRDPERGPAPLVLGSDAAGRIAESGEEVVIYPAYGWGDREDAAGPDFEILGVPRPGTHAERIAVPRALCLPKPPSLSFAEAAALPVAGLTAWRALTYRGGVEPGMAVLVTGAASGTGVFAVQLARTLGARVFVTTSSAEKLERLQALGAAGGADWRDPEWPDRIHTLAGGAVDVAVDSAGASTWPGILRALRDGGTLVNFGDTGGDAATVDVFDVFWRQISIHGSTLGSPREFTAFLAHVERTGLRPVVDTVFPLSDCRAAHARLDDPGRFGKVVLVSAA